MKILIIDDTPESAESLKLTLVSEFADEKDVLLHHEFETAYAKVKSESPDVVVLDIFKGVTKDDPLGEAVGDEIWNHHFCPFVIYTAHPQDRHAELEQRSPFIKLCPKGDNAETKVSALLQGFSDHINTVKNIHEDMLDTLRNSLKHVGNVIWTATTDPQERTELVKRVTRRRVAASLDYAANSPPGLYAWEQFIYPAIHRGDLLTGDILLDLNANDKDPNSYRIVLTPSCDMVNRGGQVEEALVAHCQPIETFMKGANIEGAKQVGSIASKLTLDQVNGFIPLPSLPSVLPLMAVNLKMLALIPLKQIQPHPIAVSTAAAQTPSSNLHKFKRIASVDSPFRERIAWAYVQVSGRPGMPDIAYSKFAEEIKAEVSKSKAS